MVWVILARAEEFHRPLNQISLIPEVEVKVRGDESLNNAKIPPQRRLIENTLKKKFVDDFFFANFDIYLT